MGLDGGSGGRFGGHPGECLGRGGDGQALLDGLDGDEDQLVGAELAELLEVVVGHVHVGQGDLEVLRELVHQDAVDDLDFADTGDEIRLALHLVITSV